MKRYMMILLTAILAVGMVTAFGPDTYAQSKKTTTGKQKKSNKSKQTKTKKAKECLEEDVYLDDVDCGIQYTEIRIVDESDSSSTSYEDSEDVFMAVDVMAQFPGGQAGLYQWLSRNLIYPVEAQKNGIEGRVIVQFVVEKDGSITNAKVVKGVDLNLDKEALRVVGIMPRWSPGKYDGEVVRSIYTLPIVFKLTSLNSTE